VFGGLATFAVELWRRIFGNEIKKEFARRQARKRVAERKARAARRRVQRRLAKVKRANELFTKLSNEATRREQAAVKRVNEWQQYKDEHGIDPEPLAPNPFDSVPPRASDR
jgi:hypothetical protein